MSKLVPSSNVESCQHCGSELVAVAMNAAGWSFACPCGLTTRTVRASKPAPDYNPRVDHPERYSDGRPI